MRLHSVSLKLFSLAALSLSLTELPAEQFGSAAQPAFSSGPQTVEAALHTLTDKAAVVFIGTVTAIRRNDEIGSSGVVEIEFQVEEAIGGCSVNSTYVLREWSGLWQANSLRYTVGRRLLMLLHAPGATGLSSPVGGMDGAIPVRASGSGITSDSSSTGTSEPVVDLRWIATRLVRPTVYRTPVASGSLATARASLASGGSAASAVSPSESSDASSASVPAQEAALSSVVSMIRSWQGGADAAR